MHSSLSVIKDWNDSPNGLFAFNCDFPSGADLRQVASIGDDCSQFCAETDRCTHYTWRPSAWYQWPFGGAGVCFMKSGSISIFDAQPSNDNQVCGLINPQNQHQPVNSPISWINSPNGPYSFNCDFVGGDYIVVSKTKVHEECAQLCEKNQPCSHYAWAPLNDGTCWLKNGTTTASMAVASSVDQIVCGLLKSTSNPTETTSSSVAPFQTSNSISWIDSVNGPYSFHCDFVSQDYANIQNVPGDQCSQVCANDFKGRCSHYAWTPVNGGTCWLKNGRVVKEDAIYSATDQIVCGLLNEGAATKTVSITSTSSGPSPTPGGGGGFPDGGATFPPRPIGSPPTSAPSGNYLSMPLYYCSRPGSCEWQATTVVLDGFDRFNSRDIYAFPGGFRTSLASGSVRMYLVDPSGARHQKILLKNRVLSIDVDTSQIQCGYNGAFYFSEMDLNSPVGRNYCDAQGTCNEMDIVEANVAATQVTSHPCKSYGVCDHGGCPVNARYSGFGPHYNGIDSRKPYTVTTTFRTDTGNDFGTLSSIEQVISQGNNSIQLPSITQNYCSSGPDQDYYRTGGLAAISQALDRGMTMVFSLWGDGGDTMSWLDGGQKNSDCRAGDYAGNSLKFSNLVLSYILK